MELIRCHIEGFGRLCDLDFDFHAGLNAFCIENGGGKTTLCAFIKCMLYGLSESRKQDLVENERKHYLPWQGGGFGGSLTLSHGERIYRIVRRFGARPAEDRLEVYDEETGARTDALGTCPGATVLSMDAPGFRDAAVFSERAFSLSLNSESVLSLMGAQRGANEGSLDAALARLAQDRKQYERVGGRGLLQETDAQIARITERQAALAATAEGADEKEAAFLAAKEELAALSLSEHHPPAPARTEGGRKKRHLLFSLLCALFLSSSALGFFISPFAFALLIPAVVFLFLAIFQKNAKSDLHFDKIYKDAAVRFEEKYRTCAERQKEYEAAASAKEEISYLTREAALLKEKRSRMEQRLSDIKKAEALLTEAGRRYREATGKAMLSHFRAHLSALGEEGSERFCLDDRLRPSLLSSDAYRSADALSRAGKDAVSLSRGLSLLHAMPRDAKPPLLLDDPFLSYDDGRLSGALGLLDALAKEFQILYFTCSHSRMP